jgi:uncharacterized protein (TIGR03437 family)
VKKLEAVVIYASGLGPVEGTVITGSPASSSVLEPAKLPVECILAAGGREYLAQVLFAGSAPGFIGVNQLNVVIPDTVPAGIARLKLRAGGVDSNEVLIAIE